MPSELERRKEAVRLYYYEGQSKAEICRQIPCTRPWLNRWLGRYDPDDVEGSLSNRSKVPKKAYSPWSTSVREQVKQMRRDRAKTPYQLCGAEAIHYELKALDAPEVPPVRTIHRWLKEADLVEESKAKAQNKVKPIPLPEATAVNQVHHLDLKGPIYLQGSAQKHYLVALRDGYSRQCALDGLKNRKAQGIVDFLVSTWQWMGLPTYLQMDNALEFRGSNRYPRSFGRVVRVALDLGVEPVFIPPAEPWRNGIIETFNSFLQERLLAVECVDMSALRQQAKTCQQACNQQHRLPALDGLTPNEVVAKADINLLSPAYHTHQQAQPLPQNQGFVSFVRLIRKSGRITLGAKDRFMVDPDLAYTYVLARVNLAQRQLVISQGNQTLLTYDYSSNTVGTWAADD